jgi:hypothetical protein
MATTEDYTLTVEEAIGRLAVIPDYDSGGGPQPCVHAIRQAGMDAPLLGAHWTLDEARHAMETWGVASAGPLATGSGHGVVVVDAVSPIFFETVTPR